MSLGITLGLVVGKTAGITLFSALAVRLGIAELPERVSWRSLHGAAWLGGIGFTMSLFIAGLAFRDAVMLDAAKLAVLASSGVAGVIGFLVLRGLPPVTLVGEPLPDATHRAVDAAAHELRPALEPQR